MATASVMANDTTVCRFNEEDRGKRLRLDRAYYPTFIIYPELGMFFTVEYSGEVTAIIFEYKCAD